MSYALYVDPGQNDALTIPFQEKPELAYYRLTDLNPEDVASFNPFEYPTATYTTVEIHPMQWDALRMDAQRVSVVLEKSKFENLTSLKSRVSTLEVDITFNWDHRFHVSYYFKMLQYWMHMGVRHVSFYNLTDFKKWLQLKNFLQQQGFYFYDRYHAATPGHESRYQKHLAKFGNMISVGGWSRVTQNDVTQIRGPGEDWAAMSAEDGAVERLLFAFADVDGMALSELQGLNIDKAVASGLVRIEKDRLCPTDLGLWDTVGIVSQLRNS